MPFGGGSGVVGFDAERVAQLRAATHEAVAAGRRVDSDDWNARQAVESVRTSTSFLETDWLATIERVLAIDAFTRRFARLDASTLRAFFTHGSAIATTPVHAPGALTITPAALTELLADIERRWPTDADDRFITRLDQFGADDQAAIGELVSLVADDPSLIDELLTRSIRGWSVDGLNVLGVAAAARLFDPVTTSRIAAAIDRDLPDLLRTSDHLLRQHALREALADTTHALLKATDPEHVLTMLEYPDVREWLVVDDALDEETIELLLGVGLHGSIVHADPADLDTVRRRSRDAWLAFVDLADRYGATSFRPGVAAGLAIGAGTHLPDMELADTGLVTVANDPIVLDGQTLTTERLHVLIGATVATPVGSRLLFEFVHQHTVDALRSQIAHADSVGSAILVDRNSVAAALEPSIDILDLVFDDSIDHQQTRWNEIAKAEAAGVTDFLDLISTIVKLAPSSRPIVSLGKKVTDKVLNEVESSIDDEADELERPAGLAGFHVQLQREFLALLPESPTLRELVGWDDLSASTRTTLVEASESLHLHDIHTIDGFLEDLGIPEHERNQVAGGTEIFDEVADELESIDD